MHSLFVFTSPRSSCSYLPRETAAITYEIVARITPEEYQARLLAGWRRFGHALFQPTCPSCRKCLSLRVLVDSFEPNRSQRRCLAANDGVVKLVIGQPDVTAAKLQLYDRYHAAQSVRVGWEDHGPKDIADYLDSFAENPFETEEWCYYLDEKLIGVGYVDRLENSLSAIYFFHEPTLGKRSLGTFNVLSLIRRAAETRLPYVYLGYFVEGCRSLEYKARFRPNEVLTEAGDWRLYRST